MLGQGKHVASEPKRCDCCWLAHLQVGDLILKIDGQKIENVGKVPFHDGEFISLDYLISCKFPGDVCVVERKQ